MKNPYPYFNPFKRNHGVLMEYLQKQLVNDNNQVVMAPFGPRTQHIFVNGNYVMSINWALV